MKGFFRKPAALAEQTLSISAPCDSRMTFEAIERLGSRNGLAMDRVRLLHWTNAPVGDLAAVFRTTKGKLFRFGGKHAIGLSTSLFQASERTIFSVLAHEFDHIAEFISKGDLDNELSATIAEIGAYLRYRK